MKQGNVIEVRDVKKKFKVFYDKGTSLKEKLLFRNRNRYEERWVLKGINFEVKKGEAIGLIGKNGCGKSTTLKMLTRIMYPTEGTIEVKGRVSSLLELGAGFHPDMSGRENIYTNASIFGLTRKEIDSRLNDIIAFSELEEFIDNPVRTYSSGMYMRLAFSVAISVDADVLLIDEILAVGDVNFQAKCFDKLKEIKSKGTTIVLVSHALDQIEKICERSIWLENGYIVEMGIPKEIHMHYLAKMEQKRLDQFEEKFLNTVSVATLNSTNTLKSIRSNNYKNLLDVLPESVIKHGNHLVTFACINIIDENSESRAVFETGKSITILMDYVCKKDNLKGTFCLEIYRDDGVYCYGTNTYFESGKILDLSPHGHLEVEIKSNMLLPGKYYLSLGVHDENAVLYEELQKILEFQAFSNKGDLGICRLDTLWKVDEVTLGENHG